MPSVSPYTFSKTVVPSDTVNFTVIGSTRDLCDALYVGGAGVVVGVLPNDSLFTFTAIAGTLMPMRLKRVNATGTAATLMVALYRI